MTQAHVDHAKKSGYFLYRISTKKKKKKKNSLSKSLVHFMTGFQIYK
jgi:hypothetical protein